MNFNKLQEIVEDREARYAAVCGVAKSQTWLSIWTTTTKSREGGEGVGQFPHFPDGEAETQNRSHPC